MILNHETSVLGWQALGWVLQQTGRLADALAARRKAVELMPDDAEANFNLAIVLIGLGQLAEAEASCRRAIALKPDHAEAHCNLGSVLMGLGRLSEAEAHSRQAIALKPNLAQAYCNLGNALRDLGRLDEAEISCREAIALDPNLAEAHCNLANTLLSVGRLTEAEVSIRQAIALNPQLAEAHNILGHALREQGRLDEAAASFRMAIAQRPDNYQAHGNLGAVLQRQGQLKLTEAEDCFRRTVALKPDFAQVIFESGSSLLNQGRSAEAEFCYRQAIALSPGFASAYCNLGIVVRDRGRLLEAVTCFRDAIALQPDLAEAHCNLGNALEALGRSAEAVESCRQAIHFNPGLAEAHNNLGNSLRVLGRLAESEDSCRQAITLRPDLPEAHNTLGNTLRALWRFAEAEASYRQCIAVNPKFTEAYANLGVVFCVRGRLAEGEACFREAAALKPSSHNYQYYAELILPAIPSSVESIHEWRTRFAQAITKLQESEYVIDDPGSMLYSYTFYLAYHNRNNRDLMIALCRLFRAQAPSLNFVSPHIPAWCVPAHRRVKIGFCSQFFCNHTIGKLYWGMIGQLDRERFEVVIIHSYDTKMDDFSEKMDQLADKAIQLPMPFSDQQQTIAAECLDVLFYPDIGMSISTYMLAYARQAPVQLVSWGHPDTTGIDTLDYFLSAATFEPVGADEHYSERLIRLNRVPCYYQPKLVATDISRQELGLPETGRLYGCPQTLFKFHPDFDPILAAIASGDPTGHIILIGSKIPDWNQLLRERWASTFPILNERIILLPEQPHERFMQLMAHFDVLLDPIYFGSGNTMYEANVFGTPIVTWQGRFMRGRVVGAAYQQMGIEDAPIVSTLEDYAPMALELARNEERRNKIRQNILQVANRTLFCDIRAVREFEEFIIAAVEAAGRGEKLPQGWMPMKHQ
jgi:tetratricopeptide (TPR) repeat protein